MGLEVEEEDLGLEEREKPFIATFGAAEGGSSFEGDILGCLCCGEDDGLEGNISELEI